MTASNVYPAIIKYRNFEKWASIVEQAGLSSIHHSCAEFMVTEFQNKRGAIQSTMLDNLKAKLEGNETSGEEGVNAVAVSLQLTYVHLPEAYNKAVAKKQVSLIQLSSLLLKTFTYTALLIIYFRLQKKILHLPLRNVNKRQPKQTQGSSRQ